uniref:VWFA domain-containing protein n=1 Tax=Plectus sambesii TaxID=2011161 RepID=A0A914UKG3_9BILA
MRKLKAITSSLQDVLVISDAVHAADNLTQFALVTFSSVNETHVHRILGQDHTYATWQSYLTDFANNLTDNNSPFYPFFQGHSDISTGIFTTYQVIANAKQRNYNFQGSTVIFAQTSLNEFDDGLDIAVVSRMLQSVSPKLYGVNKLSNTNYDIWTTILGSNAYHLYEDYNS